MGSVKKLMALWVIFVGFSENKQTVCAFVSLVASNGKRAAGSRNCKTKFRTMTLALLTATSLRSAQINCARADLGLCLFDHGRCVVDTYDPDIVVVYLLQNGQRGGAQRTT